MKKTLAILLTLALVICMIPGSAFAATTTAATVILDNGDIESVYNGSDQTPEIAVSVNGTPVSGYTATWSGVPKEAGTYTVNVTGTVNDEPYAGTAVYTVRAVDLARATIVVNGDITDAQLNGDKTALQSHANISVLQDGEDITSYCEITSKVTGSSVRITAITKNPDGKNIITSSKFADFNVKKTLTGYEISAIAEQTYTGKAIEPYVTVKATTGYSSLTKGIDYNVTYVNNVNAGSTASVIVTGIGNYTGTLSGQFVIAQKPITGYDISITVADAAYKDGALVIPTVVVTQGDKVLSRGVDYTLYTTSKDIGTGAVTISGIGNYKGEVTKNFNIVDPSKELRYDNTWVYIGNTSTYAYTANYNGEAQKPAVTVYIGETRETATLLSSSYYNVTYTNNIKPGAAMITITGKNGFAGSTYGSFTIKETEMTSYNTSVYGFSSSYVYDGTYHNPSVTVSVNGQTLKANTDYTVKYSNNRNVSSAYNKAKITITAVAGSGYTGSVTEEFSIVGKSIYGCTASFTNGKDSSAYTGSVVVPSITVKDGLYTGLRAGLDYTVTYKNADGKAVASMKDAGKYTVVITGTGNYSGELTLSYEITGKDISGYTVTLKETGSKADGKEKKPAVASVKSGTTGLSASDYTVKYLDPSGKEVTGMKTPGTYKVVVTGKGGYSGSAYATYKITGTAQKITIAKTAYKVYKDTAPFKITATATGDGTGFSYVSLSPDVASVDANGVVTIHKLGRAKIIVTTTGMTKYEPASDEVYVKVHPDKTVLSRKPWTEGKTGSFRVRWNVQADTTMYQIRYSTSSDFKTYKTKTVTASEKYATQSTRISGLKSNTKYYVQVRAIKTVTNDYGKEQKYYGKWANWRSVVTK